LTLYGWEESLQSGYEVNIKDWTGLYINFRIMKHADSYFSPKDSKTPRWNGYARLYTGSAIIILNTLIFFVVMSLILGVAFWTYDLYRYRGFKWILKTPANAFFYKDGEPIDNGKRDNYMLTRYDFTSLEGVSPEEAAATLDDFFALTENWFN
jgi:hypothetical protein